MGAVAVIASTTFGAPERPWTPPTCVTAAPTIRGETGAWYRVDPALTGGILVGQHVTIGHARADRSRFLELDPESFAAGPVEGIVLVGTDDGSRSRLSLVDVAAGCVRPGGDSVDVIRHAAIAPSRDAIYEHRVERGTRRDLGVWRRPIDPAVAPARVLAPIGPDERFGPTWRTDLSWSDDGTELVVQTCGEVACRVRLYDVVARTTRTLALSDMGDVVGVAGDRIVAHGACRGLPCPLISVDVERGARATLDDEAGQAILGRDADGRPVVVFEADVTGRTLRRVGPDGGAGVELAGSPESVRLVPGPARAGSAAEPADGWILFAPDGRLPISGPGPVLRRIDDGRMVGLAEVLR